MAKSLSLLLCCTLFACSVWAQTQPADAVLAQKLQFKKAQLGWTANSNYFAKRSFASEGDENHSLMYTGPRKQEEFNLQLPEMKNKKVDFKMKLGPREPLFRRQ
jgi:hypothetical protein